MLTHLHIMMHSSSTEEQNTFLLTVFNCFCQWLSDYIFHFELRDNIIRTDKMDFFYISCASKWFSPPPLFSNNDHRWIIVPLALRAIICHLEVMYVLATTPSLNGRKSLARFYCKQLTAISSLLIACSHSRTQKTYYHFASVMKGRHVVFTYRNTHKPASPCDTPLMQRISIISGFKQLALPQRH